MERLTQRCPQCGGVQEADGGRIPRYGARLRCAECGGWLPLLFPVSGEEPGDPAELQAGGIARTPAPAGERPPAAGAAPPREEAREAISAWLEEIGRAEGRPLTAALLLRDYGGELVRLFDRWREGHSGRPAEEAFREELFAALAPRRPKGEG